MARHRVAEGRSIGRSGPHDLGERRSPKPCSPALRLLAFDLVARQNDGDVMIAAFVDDVSKAIGMDCAVPP
jgi:hypothetical protein